MLPGSTRTSMMMIAFLGISALLAACGSDTGGSGGGGGQSTTTGTAGSTSTTSGTTTTSANIPCADLCAELIKCPGLSGDCAVDCPPVDTFNATSQCADEYSAEAACVLGAADPCAALDGECLGTVSAHLTCKDTYCAANPSTAGCN